MNKVSFYLPNLCGGGVERAFLELAQSFLSEGISVDMVLGKYEGEYLAEIPREARVISLSSGSKLKIIIGLYKYLSRENTDAFLSGGNMSNIVASIAAHLARKNCVHFVNQRSSVQAAWKLDRPLSSRFWIWLSGRLFRGAAGVICNSEFAMREVIEFQGISPRQTSVVYNSIDCEGIREQAKAPIEDSWFLPDSLPVIVSIGSLTKVKDMETVIRAFHRVQSTIPCNLLILGEGPEREFLQKIVDNLQLEDSVRLPGFAINPFAALSRSAVCVSASLTEGCPNVILQALACNTPVVATDGSGGTSEVLEDGRWGYLVPCGDEVALAERILDVLQGGSIGATDQRLSQFSPPAIARQYISTLQGMIADQL